jgi:hypothetical protein
MVSTAAQHKHSHVSMFVHLLVEQIRVKDLLLLLHQRSIVVLAKLNVSLHVHTCFIGCFEFYFYVFVNNSNKKTITNQGIIKDLHSTHQHVLVTRIIVFPNIIWTKNFWRVHRHFIFANHLCCSISAIFLEYIFCFLVPLHFEQGKTIWQLW